MGHTWPVTDHFAFSFTFYCTVLVKIRGLFIRTFVSVLSVLMEVAGSVATYGAFLPDYILTYLQVLKPYV